jgi:hypothetical protein
VSLLLLWVFAVIVHLSPIAFEAAVIVSILVVILGLFGALIGLLIYGMAQYKKQNKKQGILEQPPIQQSTQ